MKDLRNNEISTKIKDRCTPQGVLFQTGEILTMFKKMIKNRYFYRFQKNKYN